MRYTKNDAQASIRQKKQRRFAVFPGVHFLKKQKISGVEQRRKHYNNKQKVR